MAEPSEDPSASGADAEDSTAHTEEVAREEDGEESSVMGPTSVKSNTSHGRVSSLNATGSKHTHSEDNLLSLNPDDVKRAITFSPSITEAMNDVVAPMREIQVQAVHKDLDQSILHKAIHRLKDEFTEARAVSELMKMYDLYTSSLVDNSLLESQCHEITDKVRQYEARHQWDPRVLKVLLIAERYRQEKASVTEEKSDLEAEVIDVSIELKHMDDIIKNKNKDIAKLQDELKKAKEIEKQVEYLETVVMRKDNEMHGLQDNYDALLQTNYKLESQCHHTSYKMSVGGMGAHDEARAAAIEREFTVRIDHLTAEKLTLKNELEEKTRLLHYNDRRVSHIMVEKSELSNKWKETCRTISKMQSENNRLLNANTRLEKKLLILRDQLTVTKSEVLSVKTSLEGCVTSSQGTAHQLQEKGKENAAYQRQISGLNSKMGKLRREQKLCEDAAYVMRQEARTKDQDIMVQQRLLADKKDEYENVTAKLYKLEQFKNRHMELLKLTRMNTTLMVKEIAGLRGNLLIEKLSVSKAEGAVSRMQNQIEQLQREYVSVLDTNLLLVRNHEMAHAAIERFEINQVANDRRIGHLMKTNIDLYTQTTSQQEIALIQSHQFHLKENEIKGLLSRLEEEDVKMERMVGKDKEKRCAIEQLHAEATSREEKVKTLKSIIESYTQLNKSISDKAEELASQLRASQTQRELVRRQRDLFGTKLLQARAETELCQLALRTAKETMSKYSTDYYNMKNDIRVLKLEIKNLRRKGKLSEGHADLILTLRQELGQASKALELQKCKNVILEQTRLPMAHRWRGLLASDPSKYEMVLKNQLLIRRLIGKTKETARLEELLKQKDTMYLSLRVLVQRRMDSYLTDEISDAKAYMRKQNRQLKSLTAELNMVTDSKRQAEAQEESHKTRMKYLLQERAREKVSIRRQTNPARKMLPPLGMHRAARPPGYSVGFPGVHPASHTSQAMQHQRQDTNVKVIFG